MGGNREARVDGGRSHRRISVLLALALFVTVAGLGASTAPAGAETAAWPVDGVDGSIIGGKPVSDGGYRFQAALLGQPFGSNDYQRHYCGGSLIGAYYVLTAAHCVDFIGSGSGDIITLNQLRVVVGRTVLSSTTGQKRLAWRIAIHPYWNPNNGRNDVAVIELAQPITGITPIKLATTGTDALERPGRLATITGWGNTIQQDPGAGSGLTNFPDRMRVTQVPIVADDECAAAYGGGIVASSMICAGRTGFDTCQGDSGGPMFVAVPGGYRQIGITSSGIGCGATGFPGIYTQVSSPTIGNFIARATYGIPT
jgi:secreted trypsin-like serine protease